MLRKEREREGQLCKQRPENLEYEILVGAQLWGQQDKEAERMQRALSS